MPPEEPVRVTRSVIAGDSLARLVTSAYDLPAPIRRALVQVGDNDNYRVTAGSARYIARLYRYGKYWLAGEFAYRFELDWLLYLHERGLPVSSPIQRRDGDHLGRIQTPEGVRYWALFSVAPGATVHEMTDEQARLFGATVAQIHRASNAFRSPHTRLTIGVEHLLDDALARILSYLGETRPADRAFLTDLTARLRATLLVLPYLADEWGIIGGDFHGSNAHFAASGTLTHFDFDLCGYGWRAYDVAVFLWNMRRRNAPTRLRAAYLAGYQAVRPLTPAEAGALSAFVQTRQIWQMGYHTTLYGDRGDYWLDDAYWDQRIGWSRAWASEDGAQPLS